MPRLSVWCWAVLWAVLAVPSTVEAQQVPSGATIHVICDSGCGTGGGSVTQGTNPWVTSVTDNAARLLGKVTFDGAQPVTQSGTWNIATLTTLTSITNPVAVTGTFWQSTQPISAAALPLPTGAATSANQTTEIASLANLDVALSTLATSANQTTGNSSMATTATNTGNIAKPSSCGITPYDSGSLDVPSFYPTAVTSTSTCVQAVTVTNTTRSPVRFTLVDGATAGRLYVNEWVNPGEARTWALGGVQLASGVKWTASQPGLNAQVRGYQ